jgi:hypothetical protein
VTPILSVNGESRTEAAPTNLHLVDEVLVEVGLRTTDRGEVASGPKVSSLSEAAQHAHRLRRG